MYLNSHKQKLNESLAVSAALVGLGVGLGSIVNQLYTDYRQRKLSCDSVTNPILKDKCRVKILDSLIDNLKSARGECEQTPDPAKCHLALMKKIDKVIEQKLKLLSQINYIQKSKAIDNQQI
jgi:hypothetical protein